MILLIDRHVPRHLFTWTFVPQTVTSWGSRSHVTPISSQYPPRVKRPNSRQAIVKSRRFVILLKKAAKKKKNNIGEEDRPLTFSFMEVFGIWFMCLTCFLQILAGKIEVQFQMSETETFLTLDSTPFSKNSLIFTR